MLFSSISFLYFFLPVVILIYLAVPGQIRNYVLLFSSLVFYAWGEPKYIFLMLLTIIFGYISGVFLERVTDRIVKKAVMIISVCLCLGVLGFFKYADFFVGKYSSIFKEIALPIGISFYTFQLISYIVDVYRGEIQAQKNPFKLAVYISMFPQLIAGPIVRYKSIEKDLDYRKTDLESISDGITRFCIGIGKKVLIANQLGELCNSYKEANAPTVIFAWMYAVAVTLQIYFDFSGYSDMAIGLGKILGFTFPENFDYPLTAKSATEFWRRWHITLGVWFRDYLYIPLGGNRVGKARQILNIIIVWFATGLWHGASWNFALWGVMFAVILIIEKYGLLKLLNKSKIISHIYLVVIVAISFIIFDSDVIFNGIKNIGYLFGIGNIGISSNESIFYLKDYLILIIIAVIGATKIPKIIALKIKEKNKLVTDIVEPILNLLILIVATASIVNGSFNPFLYFRF